MEVDHTSIEIDGTPRVNSARMGDYMGRTVRLVCKVHRVSGLSAVVVASDHGQINVKTSQEGQFEDTYVEIIGLVQDVNEIKLQGIINLGSNLDMEIVNDVIELTHDERFKNIF